MLITVAVAKLRVRKRRLILTILVSGLAFTVVFAAVAGFLSLMNSFVRASDKVYDGAVYLQISDAHLAQRVAADDPDAIARAKQKYQTDVESYRKQLATHNLQVEQVPFIEPTTTQNGVEELNMTSPHAVRIQQERLAQPSPPSASGITEVGEIRDASVRNGNLTVVNAPTVAVRGFAVAPDEALAPYVTKVSSGEIPIVLGSDIYSKLPTHGSLDSLVGTTMTFCWRNTIARDIYDDIRLSNNKTTTKGKITYGLTSESCAAPQIKKDTRTTTERAADTAKATIDASYGVDTVPRVRVVTFRIVGLLPGQATYDTGIASIVGFFGPSPLYRTFVPESSLAALQQTGIVDVSDYGYMDQLGTLSTTAIVRADNATTATRYIAQYGCRQEPCGNKQLIQEFATGYDGINQMSNVLVKVGWGLIGVMFTIALIVMMAMFSRIVDDGRREIATYRAIGIPERTLRAIFVIYGVIIGLATAVITTTTGYMLLWWMQSSESSKITAALVKRFGEPVAHQTVSFMEIPVWVVLAFVALAVVSGLLGVLLAFAGSQKHSIIDDLKLTD